MSSVTLPQASRELHCSVYYGRDRFPAHSRVPMCRQCDRGGFVQNFLPGGVAAPGPTAAAKRAEVLPFHAASEQPIRSEFKKSAVKLVSELSTDRPRSRRTIV